MGLYVKKPIQVEAFKWTGGPDQMEDPEWVVKEIKAGTVIVRKDLISGKMSLTSSEGNMPLNAGDYIIKGIKGEIYTCSASVFEASYDKVREELTPIVKETFGE